MDVGVYEPWNEIAVELARDRHDAGDDTAFLGHPGGIDFLVGYVDQIPFDQRLHSCSIMPSDD